MTLNGFAFANITSMKILSSESSGITLNKTLVTVLILTRKLIVTSVLEILIQQNPESLNFQPFQLFLMLNFSLKALQ